MDWKHLFIILFVPIAFTTAYFYFFEDVGVNYFRTSPTEFFTEVKDFVVSDPIENEFTEATEFLVSLPEQSTTTEEVVETPEPEQKAEYEVAFVGTWSADTHGSTYIQTAHFSPLVAWSHILGAVVFKSGELASPGMEKMAELGGTATLEQELNQKVSDATIMDVATGGRFDAPGRSQVQLEVSESFPLVTLVSMIAPSPDWFVAVSDINLFIEGEFVDSLRVEVSSYDAGTEEGTRFSIDNAASNPHADISALTDIPAAELPPFGYIEFTKVQ